MSDKPLVSIIIPVYNAEKHLEETILSVIGQTWPNKELIIINDGSIDNSLAIASKFEAGWIKVFSQENRGAAAARNRGIAEAMGQFIQFLDADDLLSADKIKEQIRLLEQNPGKLAISSTVHFYNDSNYEKVLPSPHEESFLFNDNDPVHFLINLWGGYTKNGSMITIHSWLTPKDIIDKAGLWNEELTLDDDGEFFCRVILNSKGIIKSTGYSYYRKYYSQQSLSSVKNINDLNSRIKAAILKKKFLLSINNSSEAQASIYKTLINIAADSFLSYPQIYKQAIFELPKVNLNYRPPIGGKISNLLSEIVGWKTIIFLKKFLTFTKW